MVNYFALIGVLPFIDAITGYKAKRRRKEAREILDHYVSTGRYTQKEADVMWKVITS